jgi:hypothetical protein
MAQGPDECHRDRTAVRKKAGSQLGAHSGLDLAHGPTRPKAVIDHFLVRTIH